ncbi:IMP cyclohydrolase [Desulfonatronovibrio hydrogenovorans]|uniref:IMP cyclohydrolase n=1 Tax=Desulfonatronovibrio hydrogenovorans TaxID=53245 RepID=UPI000490340E|nr:IMP cyclohydrolase [Desulfonatronovibrio hydrogenovorans]
MKDLKNMYKDIHKDSFPQEMSVRIGDQELKFRKRTWIIDGQEKGLRYGENPDQPAALYEPVEGSLELGGVRLRSGEFKLVSSLKEDNMIQAGKHPGKTNLTDVDNGLNILQYLTAKPAAVILKHNNPCGAAWSDQGLFQAVENAFFSDRIAAFGGAIVMNRPVDKDSAEFMAGNYLEVVAAPDFESGALEILQKKKNLRILKMPGLGRLEEFLGRPFLDIKSLTDGGMIVQLSFSNRILAPEDFLPATAVRDGQEVTARTPDQREMEDLVFAWAVEAGVTSNSVIFAKNGRTVSIGTGEQDRVGCVDLTISKAYTKYSDLLAFEKNQESIYQLRQRALNDSAAKDDLEEITASTSQARGGLPGSVLVSDGFFPFRDGVDLAVDQGITAIAQPGGSIRDIEVIQAVNEAVPQVAMVFTGQRSFRH